MEGNRIICTTNQIDYLSIRKAMCEGVRTMDELAEQAGVCKACQGCAMEAPQILASVCSCQQVSLQEVIEAVKNGADTVEKVSAATGAGTGENCGRCKILIGNVILLGR